LTVTETVRPAVRCAGVCVGGWLGAWVAADGVEGVGIGGDPAPPHAVRPAASASPAAYETARRRVELVTLRSVGRHF
jgi:hypothetical protein